MKNLKFDWKRSETYPKPEELTVLGTFLCGGGSTMGYRLAGFQHLGGVEIDPKMATVYRKNHDPKYFYLEDLRDFNLRNDLPEELYHLDILDGSPPCTTFSMCGNREEDWGKIRKYREGQQEQTLDDLVFVYCDTIAKLQPKVALLENVPGIVAGRAKGYAIEIVKQLNRSGYDVQIFSLNAATMGVPQSRERIFFIARRRDLKFAPLVLEFNEPSVPFGEIADRNSTTHKRLWPSITARLPLVEKGEDKLKFADARYRGLEYSNSFFSTNILYDHVVAPTLTCSNTTIYYEEQRNVNDIEYRRMQSFPLDFDFCNMNVRYICGMSVPPLMMKCIAEEIKKQWLYKL